jgi:AcrR family transcriptional regulator
MAAKSKSASTPIRRTPRRRDRYEQMVEVAAEVFKEKGYDGASVQDVADAVGILKGSFYHYIDTKEDLLFAVIQKAHKGTAEGNTAWREVEEQGLPQIRAWVEGHLSSSFDHLVYAAVYFRDAEALAPERYAEIIRARDEYQSDLRKLVEKAAKRKELRKGVNPSLATLGLFGMLNWIYYWYRPDGPLKPEEVVTGLADQAMASLAGEVP